MLNYLFQDFSANGGHPKIAWSLVFFRLVQIFARKKGSVLWWVGMPLMVLYRLIVEWILSIELKPTTQVGSGLKIEHGFAIVVNDRAVLGRNVHLRQCTTIGCVKLNDGSQGPSPILGDNVEVGANTVILGGIQIGNNSKIGAGSVVLKDVPPNAVVAGNPARIIRINE